MCGFIVNVVSMFGQYWDNVGSSWDNTETVLGQVDRRLRTTVFSDFNGQVSVGNTRGIPMRILNWQ